MGTVWIAVATPEYTRAFKHWFGKDRGRTVFRSTMEAMNLLRLEVKRAIEKS